MLRFLEKNKVRLVYFPLCMYWLVLLAATSFPTSTLPSVGTSDKILHFTAYLVLGVLLNLTLLFQNKYTGLKSKSNSFTILIGSMYAIMDEVHQHFIPGRSMEFMDFAADFFGLVLAVVFVLFIVKLNQFIPDKNN